MAVSNLNEFTLVKNQIIKEALREIEACSADRESTSNDLVIASTKLNMMTKSWIDYKGVLIDLTKTELLSLMDLIDKKRSQAYFKEAELIKKVSISSTIEEVNNIILN